MILPWNWISLEFFEKGKKDDGKEEVVPAVSVIDKNVLARDPSNSSDGPFLKCPDNGKRVRDKRAGEERERGVRPQQSPLSARDKEA